MIIGIDLGTTFSVGAWVDADGKPHVAPSRDGGHTTASVVMFEDGKVIVGKKAKDNAALDPYGVIPFVKRSMGKKGMTFFIDDKEYSPEEISAMILKRVKEDCEAAIGEKVTDAVITVPAYFSDPQRKATSDAGKIAGLNVRMLINEPTAAALAYVNTQSGKAQKVMVYDIGGGTFDVTIIEICNGGKVQVLATHGNKNLGGVNFDNLLINYARDEFTRKTGIDISDDDEALQILRSRCEEAKKALSDSECTTITMTAKRKSAEIKITREMFEKMIAPLIEETEIDIDVTLEDSGLSPRELDKVLLVGGSSRIPMIKDFIRKKLNINPSDELDPDEVVAIGAAIYGSRLEAAEEKAETSQIPEKADSQEAQDAKIPDNRAKTEVLPITEVLQDVNSHGLGVVANNPETNRMMNNILIPRNQPIPTSGRQTFATIFDNQERVEVQVTEGDDEELAYVSIIGTATIDLPPHPAGSPITIELGYDGNGIITGRVFDEIEKKYVGDIRIDRKANMSENEVRKSAERIDQEEFE